jgi:hypothetical protein
MVRSKRIISDKHQRMIDDASVAVATAAGAQFSAVAILLSFYRLL